MMAQVQLVRRPRLAYAATAARLLPTVATAASRRQQQQQVLVEEQEEQQQQQHSNNPLVGLVDRLLHRAASSLTRGSCVCLACQGSGACSCPLCNGQGLTDASHSRHNQVRHAAQKLKSVLHLERADYNVEWLQSNRCRRCHGRGFLPCASCNGLGVRHARPPPPPPQH